MLRGCGIRSQAAAAALPSCLYQSINHQPLTPSSCSYLVFTMSNEDAVEKLGVIVPTDHTDRSVEHNSETNKQNYHDKHKDHDNSDSFASLKSADSPKGSHGSSISSTHSLIGKSGRPGHDGIPKHQHSESQRQLPPSEELWRWDAYRITASRGGARKVQPPIFRIPSCHSLAPTTGRWGFVDCYGHCPVRILDCRTAALLS